MNKLNKTDKTAILAIGDAISAVGKMIEADGEQPTTANIVGFMSMMAVRMLDDFSEKEGTR